MKQEDKERIEKEAKELLLKYPADKALSEGRKKWYIAGATSENERMAELLKQKDEAIETLLEELIYESGNTPGLFWMWGRTGGSKVPDKIMKIKATLESLKLKSE